MEASLSTISESLHKSVAAALQRRHQPALSRGVSARAVPARVAASFGGAADVGISKLARLFTLRGPLSLFDIFGIVDFRRDISEDLLGRNLPKIYEKILEIQPSRLENRVLEPPKSSLEASKMPFLKDL